MVNQGSAWDWNTIKIDSKSKKLSIKRRSFLNNNNALEFSLDGWTGRYGMPVEFLLAVHKATMMPDLAMDMVSAFPTEIALLLHKTSGEAQAGYKLENGTYVTYEKIEEQIHLMKNDNFFAAFLNWFDDWITSGGEVEAARRIGIAVGPPHCTGDDKCTTTEMAATPEGYIIKKNFWGTWWVYDQDVYSAKDPNVIEIAKGTDYKKTSEYPASGETLETVPVIDTACSHCKEVLKGINKYMKKNQDYNFNAFSPYIAQVTDHWYRDVYFVVNKNSGDKNYTGNLDFVDYDYNYEALVDERWTLYETYTNDPADGYKYNPDKAGEFIIYEIDEEGKFKKDGGEYVIFDGTFADARPVLLFVKDGNEYVEYTGSRENITGTVYKFTSDGKYVEYTGDIAVSKKAVTKDSEDEDYMDDIAWKKNSSKVWSAYDLEDTVSGWEPLFTEEDMATESNETYKEVMKNCYINLNLTGNLIQKGEGQRTETNTKIKKMFLNNNYFRYSGDEETAEIITELRDKVGTQRGKGKTKYGPIADSEMDISISRTGADGQTETHVVKDYVGKVMLNQDSLNAFSMLENTHTLDADYIYRDFKELVVELGYFTKEEITAGTIRRVMQFPVAGIGTGGYPDRTLDKLENEFGTMIHSEGDLKANEKNKLIATYLQAAKDLEDGVTDEEIDSGVDDTSLDNVSGISGAPSLNSAAGMPDLSSNVGAMTGRSQAEIEAIVGGMGQNFERISQSGDGYDYVVKCGTVQYTHYYQFKGSYAEKTFTWAGQTKTLHRAACGPTSCVNLLTGYGEDVNPTDNIVGISFAATMDAIDKFMEEYGVTGELITGGDTAFIAAIEEAFAEGRPIIALMSTSKTGDTFWTSGGHFVPMIGLDSSGNVITLDSGSSNAARHTYSGGIQGLMSMMTGLWVADKAPDGMARQGAAYTGYKGNEAVVSPVTGILLEYDTYSTTTDERTDGEKYRVNTDLLYGKDKIKTAEDLEKELEETGNDNTDEEPKEPEGPEVIDRVGYAKILVLDAESYQKLESLTTNKWTNDSLVHIATSQVVEKNKKGEIVQKTQDIISYSGEEGSDPKEGLTTEDCEDWTQVDKTVYGYKEFAELYNAVGIAGYVVYIDGFVLEKPDKELAGTEEEMAEQLPDGAKLKMSDFAIKETELETIVPTDDDNDSNDNTNTTPESLYVPDEVYKLASKKAYQTAKTEMDLRNLASPSVAIDSNGEELIFIKEGTILGRTMTDKELVTEIRENSPEPYEAYRVEESTSTATGLDNEDRVLGNYIRTIFRDLDGTVVENVEDYMKIDTMGAAKGDQEYKAWEGDLEILAEIMVHESSYSYLSISDRFKNDQKEADFEMYCMGYSVVNKLLEQNKQWYGHLYDESRTDRSPLAQVVTSAWYGPREKLEAYINGSHPGCYTEKELEYAEYCLTYDCTSITKPSDTPLGSAAAADGYSTTPSGSVIPRCMCQQGGYGDGAPGQSNIILVGFWDHNDDGSFGTGDELWGVDRAMEHLID